MGLPGRASGHGWTPVRAQQQQQLLRLTKPALPAWPTWQLWWHRRASWSPLALAVVYDWPSQALPDLEQGQVSRAALEVKQRLRGLAPAEGIAVLAWLVDSMARNVDPAGGQHVGRPCNSLPCITAQRMTMLSHAVMVWSRAIDVVMQVGHWLGSLADFTGQCAARCATAPPE